MKRLRSTILDAAYTSADKFCGDDQILIRYLREYALSRADWILTVINNKTGLLVGFALIRKHGWTRQNRWVELDVICAWDIMGLGTRILEEVERYSKLKGATLVELHSVPNAIPFYRSRGYINADRRVCVELPEITKAFSQVNEKRFKTPKQAVTDREYSIFLRTLTKFGSKAGTFFNCKNIGLRYPQCSFYGYRMNKCLV